MRHNGHGVVEAVSEALRIGFDEAEKMLLLRVDPVDWDDVGELAIEALAAREIRDVVYDDSPEALEATGAGIEAGAQKTTPARNALSIGDAVKVGSMETRGVVLKIQRDKTTIALANGRKLTVPEEQRGMISRVEDDELFAQLGSPGLRRVNRAARAATLGSADAKPGGRKRGEKPKMVGIVGRELFGIARTEHPESYTPQLRAYPLPGGWWSDISIQAFGAFAGMKAEAWQRVKHGTRVGGGVARISGDGGYVVYPFSVLCLGKGNAPRTVWVAPEAYRDAKGEWRPVTTLFANGIDITTDVLTAIGMLWRQVFKCQAPLHRQGTPWNKRACATCAMHVKGRMDGIFDPSDPMSGCRHWCAAGPELVPLDEEAVRVGNDILRMLGGDKTEHHWVRRGERWLKPSSLRTQDIWDSCCEKHCFPREMGSPRVRLVEGIGIHRCVIDIPGNPLADEDGDGGVVSNARQLTAVLVRKK